jgi:ABC-type bacteriocin/lantibiotic exporter with double-glycine peptidase domain
MLKLKPFEQSRGMCGVASLKIVLHYFGVEKTESELAKLSGANAKTGTKLSGILKAAQKLGFKARFKDLAVFTDIKNALDRKIPVIVDWFSKSDGHYSVVCGLDARYIYLMDPEFARMRKFTRAYFKRVWFDFPGDYIKTKNDVIMRRMIVIEPIK